MQKRIGIASFLAVIMLGCQSTPDHPRTLSWPNCCLTIHGSQGIKTVPSSDGIATLRDLFGESSPQSPTEVTRQPELISINRNGQSLMIPWNASLIEETELGNFLVTRDDRIEVVAIETTSLYLSRKPVVPFVIPKPPDDSMNLAALFQWVVDLGKIGVSTRSNVEFPATGSDIDKLKAIRGRANNTGDVITNQDPATWVKGFIKEMKGKIKPLETSAIAKNSDQKDLSRRYQSRINSEKQFPVLFFYGDSVGRPITATAGLGSFESNAIIPPLLALVTASGERFENAVFTLERTIEGRNEYYMFPVSVKKVPQVQKTPETRPYEIEDYFRGAFLFDGDILTLTTLDDVPLLKASKMVSESVVQPSRSKRNSIKLLEKHSEKSRQLQAAEPWWGQLGF